MAFRTLKPLVVFFLRNAIPYQMASDWLKRIYIDTAFENKEFRINPDKKQTKTRVAVLTGLSRVEIDRVLKIEKPIEATEQKWNRATKVLSAWATDPDYIETNGKPKVLPIYGKNSFSALVEKYSGGATMRSVLDELEKVKSVSLNNEKVTLLRKDYSQQPDKQKLVSLELFGLYTGSLLDTLIFNDKETNPKNKRYQKIVIAWDVKDDKIADAKHYIYTETDKLLVKIDKKLSRLKNKEKTPNNTSKIGLGTYYFEEKNHHEK